MCQKRCGESKQILYVVVTQRRWWVGNVEGGIALAEREALSALEHLKIEIQVCSNSQ
jgi:hypothetical protein